MKIGDLFYETWHALSANKGRSFLTILGIVIGIAAVIAMTSLIAGVKYTVFVLPKLRSAFLTRMILNWMRIYY